MRHSPFAAAALLLLAAGFASAQIPATVAPLPFTPYVPPGAAVGLAGRAAVQAVIPDIRVLAGASYYNTEAERIYRRLYGPRMYLVVPAPEPLPAPIVPEIDPMRAVVTIQVAETAEVFVEDQKLKQPGPARQFTSPILENGQSYRYTVKVRWLDKGREREQTIQVPVQAGDHTTVVLLTPTSK
jgi:uncharacterized protein (TIGR03000 family)